MSNIFNITEERLRLINAIEEAEGELTPEMEEAFTINIEEAASKLDDYCYVLKLKESEIQLAEDEIETYKARIAARKSTITRLKDTMLVAVKLFGTDKKANKDGIVNKEFKTEHHNLYTQKAKKLVNEDNESINVDNFDDDRYNRYAIGRKFTKDEVDFIEAQLLAYHHDDDQPNVIEVIDLNIKREVDTAKLKEDLLNEVVISTAAFEKVKMDDEEEPSNLVDAYIILNDSLRIK